MQPKNLSPLRSLRILDLDRLESVDCAAHQPGAIDSHGLAMALERLPERTASPDSPGQVDNRARYILKSEGFPDILDDVLDNHEKEFDLTIAAILEIWIDFKRQGLRKRSLKYTLRECKENSRLLLISSAGPEFAMRMIADKAAMGRLYERTKIPESRCKTDFTEYCIHIKRALIKQGFTKLPCLWRVARTSHVHDRAIEFLGFLYHEAKGRKADRNYGRQEPRSLYVKLAKHIHTKLNERLRYSHRLARITRLNC